jgi:hypothetical protein
MQDPACGPQVMMGELAKEAPNETWGGTSERGLAPTFFRMQGKQA